jgi:hypothetical protein
MTSSIEASVLGTSMKFSVTPEFAMYCLHHVGDIVHHESLGMLLCEEIHFDSQAEHISAVLFLGTSQKGRRRWKGKRQRKGR